MDTASASGYSAAVWCVLFWVLYHCSIMAISKYWFVKRFPEFDRLTKDNEFVGFLFACLSYQTVCLPILLVYTALSSPLSDLEWWAGYSRPSTVDARTLVLSAQIGYVAKDFFFKDAIADGDIAMWAHHFLSMTLLVGALFNIYLTSGSVVVGVGFLEFGSCILNFHCICGAFNRSDLLSWVDPLFLFSMIFSNVSTAILLGVIWGIPDARAGFRLVEFVATFLILQLAIVRTTNALKLEELLVRKIFRNFCPKPSARQKKVLAGKAAEESNAGLQRYLCVSGCMAAIFMGSYVCSGSVAHAMMSRSEL
mmetsp:Transcript_21779/g.30525  ORF Transcript_21779/g.30525 Transcript_21779/m.30525 type:complete len:309 (+) Transcript_21779:101-1027(+)|eukprot:jgi/Bigna1/89729/estExt_fgenesh1_pg.C_540100